MVTNLKKDLKNIFLDGVDPMEYTAEPDNDQQPWLGWRYLNPNAVGDLMIISSYGSEYPRQVKKAEKVVPAADSADRLVLAREEADMIMDLYKQSKTRRIVYSYSEYGRGQQMSKDYYLHRMRKLLTETDKELVVVCYTGNSEEGSGNWCFKDGVISFQDIYDLYNECFKGKRLSIISDCSYSGSWIKECVKIYDNQGILPCGHHSREKGLLFRVLSSCKSYQQATIMTFVKEAMRIMMDRVTYTYDKPLSSGQTTTLGEFCTVRCDSKPDECCQYTTTDPPYTWENMILKPYTRVYTIHCRDKGRLAWYCILVDEEKEQLFEDKKVKHGRISVGDYGKVLYSGWGDDPPQAIKDKMEECFKL